MPYSSSASAFASSVACVRLLVAPAGQMQLQKGDALDCHLSAKSYSAMMAAVARLQLLLLQRIVRKEYPSFAFFLQSAVAVPRGIPSLGA